MDERLITILKAVAYGETVSDEDGDSLCLYCGFNSHLDSNGENGLHEPACPVWLARAILKEQGMPLSLYRIEYEQRTAFNIFGWYKTTDARLAFSEREALRGYEDSPDPDDMRNSKRRNAKVTLIREML